MRVLVIAHNCVGDSNRKRVDTLAALPGVQVALLTPPWWFEEGRRIAAPPVPRAVGYPWHVGSTAAINNGTRYVYLNTLFGLVRRFQPDVIDLHEEPFSFAALQTLLARDLLAPGAALVFYSAVNVHRRWRLPYHLVERVVLRRADGAYAPNADVPPILRAKGLRAPTAVIPLGVDVERFASATPMDLDGRLAGAPRPYVGFLGRLEPVKGLDYLIEAAGCLQSTGTTVVVGDGPEKGRLERLAAERGVRERVRFLPGLPFAAVPAFLKALDALALPSITIPPEHKEQFGRVLVEAMAAGVPVVGSSSGAIPEVIGDAGLVVPERDAVALATALDRLLGDAALRADLVARGRRRAADCYGWEGVARQDVALYRQALAHRRGRPGNHSWADAKGQAEVVEA